MKRTAMALFALICLSLSSGCGLFVKRIPPGEIPCPTEKDHFVRVEGINFHYTEYPGPGETVFLLHGFGSSTYSWEKVAPLLQDDGFHVYALDMKGFGWSDKPRGSDYSPLALVEGVNAWMDTMGLQDVVFVGNSLGGAVAVLMSILHPDKVGRMVLVDAGGYPMDLPTIVKAARIPGAAFFSNLFYGRWAVKWNLKEVYYNDDWLTDEQVQAYYDRLRSENALNAMVELARAIDFNRFAGYIDRARKLKVPTLILWGEDDQWIPLEIGRQFHRDLPDSRLVVIPECGHVPQEEYPGVTAQVISQFIRGTLDPRNLS
jgi:pimeloyl-ACP methyl ester carboxylesterase